MELILISEGILICCRICLFNEIFILIFQNFSTISGVGLTGYLPMMLGIAIQAVKRKYLLERTIASELTFFNCLVVKLLNIFFVFTFYSELHLYNICITI